MRYFFHTIENGTRTSDEDGVECADDQAAKDQATQFLAEIAAELIPSNAGRRFGVQVTDESGGLIAEIGFAIEEGPDVGA